MRSLPCAPLRTLLGWEMRRLWRTPWPWLLVAATLLPLLFGGDWRAPALGRYDDLLTWMPLIGAALSAVAAWAARREERSGVDEVILAWPVASRQLALARTLALGSVALATWLELALPLLAYTFISYASAAPLAGVAYPLGRALQDGGLIAYGLLASLLAAQAIGQVAGALLPGLAALVGVVIFRAATMIGPGGVMGTLQWPWALAASPEGLFTGWSAYTQGLGLDLHGEFFLTQRLLWLGGSLAIIAGLTLLWRARRDVSPAPRAVVAAAALLLALGSAWPFAAHEQRRAQAFAQALAAYGEPVKPPLRPAVGSEAQAPARQEPSAPAARPIRYGLAVDLTRAPEATIQATLELVAGPQAAGAPLVLTLRRAFHLDEVLYQGRPVPAGRARREGDLIRIVPDQAVSADQPFTVSLRYHGRIEDWRLDPYETPVALARQDLVLLPASWGWYPVPGEHRLTWEVGMTSLVYRWLVDRTQPFDDAEPLFDVTVTAPAQVRSLAGFDRGGLPSAPPTWRLQARQNRLALVGGAWQTVERGKIRYLVPLEELDTWEAASADLHRLLTATMDWTGIGSLTVIPETLSGQRINECGIVDSSWFGDVYRAPQAAPGLIRGLNMWLYRTCGIGTWQNSGYTEVLAYEVLAYAERQIVADAFGADTVARLTEQGALPSTSAADPQGVFERWAARTPAATQREQLRALFAAARWRPLTPADLVPFGAPEER